MGSLDDAMRQLEAEEQEAGRRAMERTARQATIPAKDPEVQALIDDFRARVAPGSDRALMRRWSTQHVDEYLRSGLLRRRHKRLLPIRWTEWKTEVVDRGWPVLPFGKDYIVQHYNGEGQQVVPEIKVRHTVAITSAGALLLAGVLPDGTTVVDGDAGAGNRHRPPPVVGEMRGGSSVRAVLLQQFPINPPKEGPPRWHQPNPNAAYTAAWDIAPGWDGHKTIMGQLAEALARMLRGNARPRA